MILKTELYHGMFAFRELTPTLTDYKGPTIFICYRRIFVIANIENKEKPFQELKNGFRYRRISASTGESVIAGFNGASISISRFVCP